MVLQYYSILRAVELVRESVTGGQIEVAKMLWIEINDSVLPALLFSLSVECDWI